MKTYQPYQMTKTCQLGAVKSVKNKYSGVNIPTFVASKTVHYAPLKRTFNQKYELVGTRLDETTEIAIQHQDIGDAQQVKIGDITYNILDNSIDDSVEYLTYDILTLKDTTKVGSDA